MRYVEYDERGNIFHICEALIADPLLGPNPALFGGTPEEIAAYQKQIDDHQAFGRSLQLASLLDSHQKIQKATPLRGIHVLDDTEPLPTHDGHVYDRGTGKVRAMTATERQAWVDAHPTPPVPTPAPAPTPTPPAH